MDAELKTKWLNALRSGQYEQATGELRDIRGFCCLGVLCDLLGADWTKGTINGINFKHEEEEYLNDTFGDDLGLPYEVQRALADKNDGNILKGVRKQSFDEIADYIEANL